MARTLIGTAEQITRAGLAPLTTPRDRALAIRYAADLLNQADESPVDRQALVMAAAMLAAQEGHPTVARSVRRLLAPPPTPQTVPWRHRLADRKDPA